MRRVIAALLVALATGCGTVTEPVAPPMAPAPSPTPAAPAPSPTPTVPPTPTPASVLAAGFDVEVAMGHVRALAVDIGNREAGTEGDVRAAAYIMAELERLGYDAFEQAFPLPQGGESSNVVGRRPGAGGRPYLIVGGHRDSLRGPGANDNATGIAASLEIMRVLAGEPAPLPVVFVAFGAEEVQPVPGRVHHVGSRHYVDQLSADERENLVAFLNLDMIGRGDHMYAGRMDVGPREATERLLAVAAELGVDVRERVTPDWSDNGSFLRGGLNAGWLWTGDDPCCVHTEHDTIDRVRPADLERAGRVALATLRSYR